MLLRSCILAPATIAAMLGASPAQAETLKSSVGFNNSIGQKTDDQPAESVKVSYQVTLEGGDLDGCTVDIVEVLVPYEEGAWGFFDIQGELTCDQGGFAYASSGAWDGNGFHAAGEIEDGSGSGAFDGISGRVAQLGGGANDAGDGTFDINYELVFATADG